MFELLDLCNDSLRLVYTSAVCMGRNGFFKVRAGKICSCFSPYDPLELIICSINSLMDDDIATQPTLRSMLKLCYYPLSLW